MLNCSLLYTCRTWSQGSMADFPQLPLKEETLLGYISDSEWLSGPREVIHDVRLQEFKTWDPLYFFVINKDGARLCFSSWVKVHIILSLCCWGLDCRVPGNQLSFVLRTVVSSAKLMTVFAGWTARLSWVNRIYRKGLSIQPWGTPICRIRVEDVCLSDLTVWGSMVSKSKF